MRGSSLTTSTSRSTSVLYHVTPKPHPLLFGTPGVDYACSLVQDSIVRGPAARRNVAGRTSDGTEHLYHAEESRHVGQNYQLIPVHAWLAVVVYSIPHACNLQQVQRQQAPSFSECCLHMLQLFISWRRGRFRILMHYLYPLVPEVSWQ